MTALRLGSHESMSTRTRCLYERSSVGLERGRNSGSAVGKAGSEAGKLNSRGGDLIRQDFSGSPVRIPALLTINSDLEAGSDSATDKIAALPLPVALGLLLAIAVAAAAADGLPWLHSSSRVAEYLQSEPHLHFNSWSVHRASIGSTFGR